MNKKKIFGIAMSINLIASPLLVDVAPVLAKADENTPQKESRFVNQNINLLKNPEMAPAANGLGVSGYTLYNYNRVTGNLESSQNIAGDYGTQVNPDAYVKQAGNGKLRFTTDQFAMTAVVKGTDGPVVEQQVPVIAGQTYEFSFKAELEGDSSYFTGKTFAVLYSMGAALTKEEYRDTTIRTFKTTYTATQTGTVPIRFGIYRSYRANTAGGLQHNYIWDAKVVNTDKSAPAAPKAKRIDTDSSALTGTAEANTSMLIKDSAGKLLSTIKVDAKGNYSFAVSKPVYNTVYYIANKDIAGNISDDTKVTVAQGNVIAPVLDRVDDEMTTVAGHTEPKSKVTATYNNAQNEIITAEAMADDNGDFSLEIKSGIKAETDFKVISELNGVKSKETSFHVIEKTYETAVVTVDNLFADKTHAAIIMGMDESIIENAQAEVDLVKNADRKAELQVLVDSATAMLIERHKQSAVLTDIAAVFANDEETALVDGVTEEQLEKIGAAIADLTDKEKAAEFEQRLENAQTLLTERRHQEAATAAIEALFTDDTHEAIGKDVIKETIDAATELVSKVTDADKKAEYTEQIKVAQELLDTRIENARLLGLANDAVAALFTTADKAELIAGMTQETIDAAAEVVAGVNDADEAARTALESDIKHATALLVERHNQEAATIAIDKLFADDTHSQMHPDLTQKQIDAAQALVDKVKDAEPLAKFTAEIKAAQKFLDIENAHLAHLAVTQDAVENLFTGPNHTAIKSTTDQREINDVQALVNAVAYPEEKAKLQAEVDKAQDFLTNTTAVVIEKIATLSTDLIANDKLTANGAVAMITDQTKIDDVYNTIVKMPASAKDKATFTAQVKAVEDLYKNRTNEQVGNLTQNNEFDLGITEWTTWMSSTAKRPTTVRDGAEGNNVIKLEGNSSAEQIIEDLDPNTTYTLTAYVKADKGGRIKLGAKNFGGVNTLGSNFTQDKYSKGEVTFTTGPNNTKATIYLYNPTDLNGYADVVLLKNVSSDLNKPVVSAAVAAVDALYVNQIVAGGGKAQHVVQQGALHATTTVEKIAAAKALVTALDDKYAIKATLLETLTESTLLLQQREDNKHSNLLVNSDFAADFSNWKVWTGGTTAPVITQDSNMTGNVVEISPNSSLEQKVQGLKANTTYELTVQSKTDNNEPFSIGVKNTGVANPTVALINGRTYNEAVVKFTTGDNPANTTVYMYKSGGNGKGYAGLTTVHEVVSNDDVVSEVTNLFVKNNKKKTALNWKVTTATLDELQTKVNVIEDVVVKERMNKRLKEAQELLAKVTAERLNNQVSTNADFSLGLDGWKPWNSAIAKVPTVVENTASFDQALTLNGESSVERTITLKPNTAYKYTVYGKSYETERVAMGMKAMADTVVNSVLIDDSAVDAETTIEFTTGPATTSGRLFIYKSVGSVDTFIQSVRVSEVTK
ncbi:toxin Cry1Ac domain D-VI-related protein [Brochothrix thermosphacta]|uniref:toxin Cry1Ac domain D-VI-related protein n=1 Tax=Brochothrix thermosphacta TaxID=2756 RepID=UPI000D790078|nr:toxin Cry1Ac domain D-VI-related protein [Brochothrix thermosphacta]SPN74924.1 exported hypothetical protein [Brochothrix thermosphacta]